MSIYQSTKVSPYVYWLTHKTTGQFYIGYREINKVPSDQDFGFFYWTSSKKIDELGFDNFDFQILAEFFDGDSAYDHEQILISENFKNSLCLNGHYHKNGNHFRRTGPMSEEAKSKMSMSGKSKIFTIEHRRNIGKAGTGKIPSNETKKKLSIANKGQRRSDEVKAKMSASAKGKFISDQTKAKMSMNTKGDNNPRAKTWVICKEIDGSTFEIKSLIWCRPLGIRTKSLSNTLSSGKFYKGFKVLEKK